jgi:hypothetical protein
MAQLRLPAGIDRRQYGIEAVVVVRYARNHNAVRGGTAKLAADFLMLLNVVGHHKICVKLIEQSQPYIGTYAIEIA